MQFQTFRLNSIRANAKLTLRFWERQESANDILQKYFSYLKNYVHDHVKKRSNNHTKFELVCLRTNFQFHISKVNATLTT